MFYDRQKVFFVCLIYVGPCVLKVSNVIGCIRSLGDSCNGNINYNNYAKLFTSQNVFLWNERLLLLLSTARFTLNAHSITCYNIII